MHFEIENKDYLVLNYNYNSITDISVIDASKFSYNVFFDKFMSCNIPCIIKNITDNWEAAQFWVKEGKPNFDYLSHKYGASNVTIYNCSERYYNSQKTRECKFNAYIDYWRHYYVDDKVKPLDYLKDWHLKLNNKDDNFYQVPMYFASDWLNEYYSECVNDDYRFVYMGPKDSWTPFHSDVFTSYSWSANVCGRKRWILFPPGEENHLKDAFGNLPYDLMKLNHTRKCFTIIQNPGEAIFVPSGWHHQVWNLEDTISVNHNWVNGCNIKIMWLSIQNSLQAIRKEIDDCKDMEDFEEHCQKMLNAAFGMDYYKFYSFIKHIGLTRMEMVKGNKSRTLFHDHTIEKNHLVFDLRAVKDMLVKFSDCDDVTNLSWLRDPGNMRPFDLLEQVVQVLENV